MRYNGGGDTFVNRPLIEGIIRSDKLQQPGKLFVIIGRGTFSAAQNTTSELERRTKAILVGEPTGSNPNFIGESIAIPLPYSGWVISLSDLWWQHSMAMDYRVWTTRSSTPRRPRAAARPPRSGDGSDRALSGRGRRQVTRRRVFSPTKARRSRRREEFFTAEFAEKARRGYWELFDRDLRLRQPLLKNLLLDLSAFVVRILVAAAGAFPGSIGKHCGYWGVAPGDAVECWGSRNSFWAGRDSAIAAERAAVCSSALPQPLQPAGRRQPDRGAGRAGQGAGHERPGADRSRQSVRGARVLPEGPRRPASIRSSATRPTSRPAAGFRKTPAA